MKDETKSFKRLIADLANVRARLTSLAGARQRVAERSGVRRRLAERVRQSELNRAASALAVARDGAEGESISAEARLRHMLAASPAIIYATETRGDFRCIFVSDNVFSIIGYSPREMTTDPKHWPSNLHPQDAARVIDRVAVLIEHGGGAVEYRFRHRHGHYVWIQDTFKVLYDQAGNPVELVGAWADISERKIAQDMLQQAYDDLERRVDKRTEELQEGRRRLEYVLAVSPAITYATKASGDFACTFASESSRQIMGYSPEEALNDPGFWVKHLHPKDAPQVLAEFARLIPQGQGNLEYRFLHKGGHYRWFQDTFQVVRDAAGHPSEIVGSWADITHRKLGEAVRELYAASLERQEPMSLKALDGILETGREVFKLDRLTILRADAKREWLQAIVATGAEDPLGSIRVPIAPAGGGLARAYETSEPVVWDGLAPVPEPFRLRPPFNAIKSLRSRVFAIIPLIAQGQAIGVLAADRKTNRAPFDPGTLDALRQLANQAAMALEHARLFAAAQPVLGRSLHLSEVYPAFARAVKALLPYDRIGVVVPEGTKLVMALSVAEPPLASWQGEAWAQSEGTAVDWVLRNRQPYVLRDTATEQPFLDSAFVAQEGVRSSLMVPLLVGGAAIGVFFLDSVTPGAYTEQDVELIDPVARQLALAIDNTRLFHEIEQKSRKLSRSLEEMKVLREVGNALNSTLDLETVLATIVADAVQLSGADGGAIYEYDEQSQTLIMGATHGLDAELVRALRENPVRYGEGSVGHAASTRAPYEVADIESGAYESRLRHVVARSGYRAILSVPLLRDDRVFGGLSLFRKAAGAFSSETVDLLRTFATQSMLAIQNARQFQEIQEKGRQIEIANRHKSQFLANMSHELRTPLNAILGYTELILDNIYGEAPPRIRETLSRVETNGRHLLGLINDVLDLSKMEAGSLTLSLMDYSMKDVVQTAVTAIEPLAAGKNLALRVAAPDDLPRGKGDDRRISQVLVNLVGNAVKFTEVGEVRVEARAADGHFVVSVADTGIGVAEADQRKIFEEFQQVEGANTRKKGGTGLGLSITKRIVEMHGGRIWLESTPGRGSTFRFTLPVRVERQVEAK